MAADYRSSSDFFPLSLISVSEPIIDSLATQAIQLKAQKEPSSSEGVYFSMAGMLLSVMIALINYDCEMAKDFANAQSNFAKALAGIDADGKAGTYDADGKYVPNTGLIAMQVDIGKDLAKDVGQSATRTAIGQGVAAAVSVCSAGAMAFSYYKSVFKPAQGIKTELNDLNLAKGSFNKKSTGEIELMEIGQEPPAEVTKRMAEFKEGNWSGFKDKTTDGADINDKAIALINRKPAERQAVLDKLDKDIGSKERELSELYTKNGQNTQMIKAFEDAASGLGQSLGKYLSGLCDAQKSADETTSQIHQQTLQGVSTTADQHKDKCSKYLGDGEQMAQQIANVLAGMTKA